VSESGSESGSHKIGLSGERKICRSIPPPPTCSARRFKLYADRVDYFSTLTFVTVFVTGHSVQRYSQKLQTSKHGQSHTVQYKYYARDLTMGYARRPAAYRAAPGIIPSSATCIAAETEGCLHEPDELQPTPNTAVFVLKTLDKVPQRRTPHNY